MPIVCDSIVLLFCMLSQVAALLYISWTYILELGLKPDLVCNLLHSQSLFVVSGHHFSILLLSLNSHHLTDYLNYHLTHAPDLVPHDWEAHDRSHNPVTDHLILMLDFLCDQACDLSHDTM